MEDGRQRQVEGETRRLVALVEEATGLRSRWNGTVRVIDVATAALTSPTPFLAKKEWSCGITIVETTLNSEGRWRSLLHEALHSVSVGLTEPDYHRFRLWEEAVVEMLQRLYRPVLFRRLGLAIAESQFRTIEENWRYNRAVDALAQIAAARPDVPLREFLEGMLRTPLPDRPAYAFEWGRQAADFAMFKRIYAAASGVLRER